MRVAEKISPHPMASGNPTRPPWRMLQAYWVTFIVLSSYLWIKFQSRFRSAAAIEACIERANLRNARRIHHAILDLQGLYIKVGQLFSIMTNFLPETFRGELEGLQDRVPPRSYAAIEQRFREEFNGQGPRELFESFDETPLASASIGQVHLATLRGGHRVAVKVQYPDIDKVVRNDLRALRRIFHVVERFVQYQGLDSVYHEIRSIIGQELDFTAEARNVDTIAKNFRGQPNVTFPKVVWELSTRRVLTTEYIEGVKVNDLRGLQQMGIDRTALARLVIETYCQQIFRHGIYHADPHPGNILVSPGPTIAFIDFGEVAVVSPKMRQGILLLLQGAINRDTPKLVQALREMGFIPHHANPRVYERVVDYFHSRFQEEVRLESFSLQDIKFDPQRGLENLADLRRMDISLREITKSFHVPKEWIMLERTILLLMGLCTELDPALNPMEVIRPHVSEFVLGKDRDWSRFMLDTARDVTLAAIALPQEIKKLTSHLFNGELEIRVAGSDDRARLFYNLGHQVIYVALGIACCAFALHYEQPGWERYYLGLNAAGAFCGLLLLRSFWSSHKLLAKRPKQRR